MDADYYKAYRLMTKPVYRIMHFQHYIFYILECSFGKYGEACREKCIDRRCYGIQRCDHTTGECVDGCIAGWQGVSCTEVKTDITTGIE